MRDCAVARGAFRRRRACRLHGSLPNACATRTRRRAARDDQTRVSDMKIDRVEFLVLNVSEKTNWSFVRVTSETGLTGIGEASLNGWESAQQACAGDLQRQREGRRIDEVAALLRVFPHSPGGLIASSVASALEQALTDLRAKAAGVPV